MTDAYFMRQAIHEAWKYQGLTLPNPSVGCCIVKEGVILSIQAHQKAGEPHAEILALKEAFLVLSHDSYQCSELLALTKSEDIHSFLRIYAQTLFKECDIYVTLEPCSHFGKTPPCATLLADLFPRRIIIGALDFLHPNGIAIMKQKGIDVVLGVCQCECEDLLLPFRQLITQGRFVLYKWAQRLNGTIDGGIISSYESRYHVHQLRSISDQLVISGQTMRDDKPLLDARLCDGKAPDICVLTRHNFLDETLPCFTIKNRQVTLSTQLPQKGFLLVEGGENLLHSLWDEIDMFLVYVAPISGGTKTLSLCEECEILYTFNDNRDIILWMKKRG